MALKSDSIKFPIEEELKEKLVRKLNKKGEKLAPFMRQLIRNWLEAPNGKRLGRPAKKGFTHARSRGTGSVYG